eukprot:scaffold1638_cov143-Skeletonema_menzelii.AAC.1
MQCSGRDIINYEKWSSHATMMIESIADEEERKAQYSEYDAARSLQRRRVCMGWDVGLFSVLEVEADFDIEQKEYYVLRNRWAELPTSCFFDGGASSTTCLSSSGEVAVFIFILDPGPAHN